MTVPALPVFLMAVLAPFGTTWLLARSWFAWQRERFVYTSEQVFLELHRDVQSGVVGWSPAADRLLALARTAETIAPTVRPTVVKALIVSGMPIPPRPHTPRADRAALIAYEERLVSAWARLLMLGSPSGWWVLATTLPPVWWRARRRHRPVRPLLVRHVRQTWIRPTDAGALARLQHAA